MTTHYDNPSVPQQRIRIIIVDDIPETVQNMKRLLEFEPREFEVVGTCGTGREALRMAINTRPDIITMDINMPDMDGIQATYEITKVLPTAGVIMISVNNDADYLRQAMQAGARNFLTKPIDPVELYNTIKAVYNSYEAIRRQQRAMLPLNTITPSNSSSASKIYEVAAVSKALRKQSWLIETINPQKVLWLDFNTSQADPTEWYLEIADLAPEIIVLSENPDELNIIQSFALSRDIPTICVISSDAVFFETRSNLLLLGANGVCANTTIEFNAALDLIATPIPVLGTEKPHIVLCSDDLSLRDEMSETLAGYGVVAVGTTEYKSINDLYQNFRPSLLVLDAQRFRSATQLTRNLRMSGIDSPLILLMKEHESLLAWHLHQMRIVDCLTIPVNNKQLQTTLQREKRWKSGSLPLVDIWARYMVSVDELNFERTQRQISVAKADRIQEFTVLSSGLIHDLRNGLGSAILRIEETQDIPDSLYTQIEYAQLLLEVIASVRFKGAWNPRPNIGLLEIIRQGAELARAICPECKFQIFTEEDVRTQTVVADRAQVRHAIAALLIAVGRACANVRINVYKASIEILPISLDIIKLDKLSSDLFIFSQRMLKRNAATNQRNAPSDAWYLTTRMLSTQQSERDILMHPVWFTLTEIPPEDIMRRQIAQLAGKESRLRHELDQMSAFGSASEIATLFDATLDELLRTLLNALHICIRINNIRIENSVRYILLLARNLAAVVRRTEIVAKPVSIKAAIHVVLELQSDLLSDCDVSVDVDENLPMVAADELSLIQILVNLTTNAAEAMHGEGKLSLTAQRVRGGVKVIVSDTGNGIAEDNISRIFELSFSTKQGYERGVGLYVVSTLVKQLKGTISVKSKVGAGTTFTLNLPKYDGNLPQ